jgi:hypothetical protein
MKAPYEKGVIQIDVTNACDIYHCSNCTRMLQHHKNKFYMSVKNFRIAVESLREYPGVVGMFGGNPCVHPAFESLCDIMREVMPDKSRRGLWTNRIFYHGEIVRRTFGYQNLNVHQSAVAIAEIQAAMPGRKIWGTDSPSMHAPILVAIKDIIPDKAARRSVIETCDINLKWSGCITQLPHVNNELRCYFCEVAAAFDHVYQEDNGLPVTYGWWRRPIADYEHQIERWCNSCGVPLRMNGHLDVDITDDYSATHAGLFGSKRRLGVSHVTVNGQSVKPPTKYLDR